MPLLGMPFAISVPPHHSGPLPLTPFRDPDYGHPTPTPAALLHAGGPETKTC